MFEVEDKVKTLKVDLKRISAVSIYFYVLTDIRFYVDVKFRFIKNIGVLLPSTFYKF